ncbi:MAG TPA: hypothetical protein VML36_03575, partial [Nitrospiria bacterium]|nr:hypothetical protein [Nitrospiria bacterium]
MNYRKMIAPAVVIAGLCGLGVSPAFAEDTSPVEQCPGEPSSCVRLNGGGSSAATPFMNEVPLVILDQGNAGGTLHYPVHYLSTNGKRATWTGTRGGGVTPTIIRYEATGSADGIQKLQHPVADSGSFMTYVDHSSPGTTCDAPLFLTNPVNGKKYFEYRNCTATVQYGMTMGMSDVNGSSFHQSSPGPTGTIIKNPLSMTGLKSTQVAQIPWTIVLGAAVQKVVNGVHQNVQNLTRTQVEEIFSGIAYDWTQLGLVVVDS